MLTWVSENPGIAVAVIGLAGTVLGGILGLLAPWVQDLMAQRRERREEQRQLAAQRRDLIASWRSMVRGANVHANATGKRDVHDYLIGQTELHTLEAHSGCNFRGGITFRPALNAGHRLPEPLEDIVRVINELEREWGLAADPSASRE